MGNIDTALQRRFFWWKPLERVVRQTRFPGFFAPLRPRAPLVGGATVGTTPRSARTGRTEARQAGPNP